MPKRSAKSKLLRKKKKRNDLKSRKTAKEIETFPLNTNILAVYTDDTHKFNDVEMVKDEWYEGRVTNIIECGALYMIEFDDCYIEQIVTIDQMQRRQQKDAEDDYKENENGDKKKNEYDDDDPEMVGEGNDRRRINPKNDICCLCARSLPLMWHHLVLKCTHNEYMKLYSDATRLFLNRHGIWICRQCHSGIHELYTNSELMQSYNTLDALLESEKVQKWIKYASKQRVSAHFDKRANRKNKIANMTGDHSTNIAYIK